VLHIAALHEVGSNNPDGVEIKKKKDANGIPLDGIAFHPYYNGQGFVRRRLLPHHLRRSSFSSSRRWAAGFWKMIILYPRTTW